MEYRTTFKKKSIISTKHKKCGIKNIQKMSSKPRTLENIYI